MMAWGAKVNGQFRERVSQICMRLGIEPNWLMSCMAFESGGTFSPSIKNAAGSGAVGLIQFMPQTAMALGTTVEALARMTGVEQLDVVADYFQPRANALHSLEDVYMAILWPAAIGKTLEYVLFDRDDPSHPKRYIQNAGLDWNHDGMVTKAEACKRVKELLDKGLLPENSA